MDPITTFQRAIDQTGRIVAAVKPDQMNQPTPCPDWDVRTLLNHTIGVVDMFSEAATGAEFQMARFEKDLVGDDPAGAYDKAAGVLRDTVSKPDVLDHDWTMPFGATPGALAINIAIVEVAQHGWDIAKATGQEATFDPDVTQAAMATAKQLPADLTRQPGVFGPEVPCQESAPLPDQLAAFLGRTL